MKNLKKHITLFIFLIITANIVWGQSQADSSDYIVKFDGEADSIRVVKFFGTAGSFLDDELNVVVTNRSGKPQKVKDVEF